MNALNPPKMFIAVLGLAFAISLANSARAQVDLRLGVWNIEKLSTSATRGFPELQGSSILPPRSDSQLQAIALYIREELKVDALMVTEIEADDPESTESKPQSAQLNRIAEAMGNQWRYFLGRTGEKMRLGLLFNTDRVKLKKLVNLNSPEFLVSGKDVLDRDPFIAWIAKNGTGGVEERDLILICVHLKSQQGPFKNNRMAAIAKLIGDFTDRDVRNALTLPSKSEEPEAIILGDCNDSTFRENGFKYMFDYLNGVGFKHLRPSSGNYPPTRVNGSQIDHLFATKELVDNSIVADSFKVHTVSESERDEYRFAMSDHFPVTVDIKGGIDSDFTIAEALATTDRALRSQRMEPLQEEAFARAAAATAGTRELSEDEDAQPIKIDADIRDKEFEEILAPSRAGSDRRTAFAVPAVGGSDMSSASALSTADGVEPVTDMTRLSARSVVPADRYAKSRLPVVFLEQNWTPAESVEFYSLQQGSPVMRRDLFNVLEQPDDTSLFRDSDYFEKFGFLPLRHHEGNLEGYPVGFTGEQAIELNCAACHTSKMTFGGKEYWIDGSQAMTDLQSWLHELVRAIRLTLADAPNEVQTGTSLSSSGQRIALSQNTKFGRFVRRLTGTTTPTLTQAKVIYETLAKDHSRRQRYDDYNEYGQAFFNDTARQSATKNTRYGFSRLDALSAILNQACAEHLAAPENARRADAPVNYPMIWDAPQHRHVQWNGAVDNTKTKGPLGRNAGQVVGVFGLVNIDGTSVGYDSSIKFESLERAESLITKLWSPQWPSEFGTIGQVKADAGKTIYAANCIQCHRLIDRDDPGRQANDVLVSISDSFMGLPVLNTDSRVAVKWNDRTASLGKLAGRLQTLPLQGRFLSNPQATVPARDILSHVVFNTIARDYIPWRDELTIDDASAQRSMVFSESAMQDNLLRYKARPLNGVWTTAPYLHNGSILNMAELLTKPDQRKSKFRVGSTEFDPKTLGYLDAGPFEFDVSIPGNSNQGHAYGTELSEAQRQQLIEYLKTL